VGHKELNEFVVGPVRAVIDSNHRIQGPRSLAKLAASLLYDKTKLERVYVAPGGFQSLFRSSFDGAHIAALQGFAATENERMRCCRHERTLGNRVQTGLRRPAMVPASGPVV
jgi:hypothetical protein